MSHDILVLGSGPAGLAAAVAARGRGKSVLVIRPPGFFLFILAPFLELHYPGLDVLPLSHCHRTASQNKMWCQRSASPSVCPHRRADF